MLEEFPAGSVLHSSPGNAFVLLADLKTWVRIDPASEFVMKAKKELWPPILSNAAKRNKAKGKKARNG